MGKNDYFKKRDILTQKKIMDNLAQLPYFCYEYIAGIESKTSALTRLGYTQDLKIFFNYLTKEVNRFVGKSVKQLELSDIATITSTDLEIYLNYLSSYNGALDKTYTNSSISKARKLSAIRSMLNYFYRKNKLPENVSTKIDSPKIKEKAIIRLEVDEIVKLLDCAECPEGFTKRQTSYNKITRKRDIAILTLMLGTGIRVSECVGLNIADIDFEINGFKITRKGGNQVILYFSNEVAEALKDYLEERLNNKYVTEEETALFLSIQNKRIGVRAVENLVKKYSHACIPLKKITPHKLRSTYGTNLYRQTGDIYIVADVLGHKDVNTTKKHYAAISEDARRSVAGIVKLREDKEQG